MNYQEAMHAAHKGKKVCFSAKSSDMLYVYYDGEFTGFRKVTYSLSQGGNNSEYIPEVYDKMRNWVIYNEEKPMQRIVKFFTRAFGKRSFGFSSNPA